MRENIFFLSFCLLLSLHLICVNGDQVVRGLIRRSVHSGPQLIVEREAKMLQPNIDSDVDGSSLLQYDLDLLQRHISMKKHHRHRHKFEQLKKEKEEKKEENGVEHWEEPNFKDSVEDNNNNHYGKEDVKSHVSKVMSDEYTTPEFEKRENSGIEFSSHKSDIHMKDSKDSKHSSNSIEEPKWKDIAKDRFIDVPTDKDTIVPKNDKSIGIDDDKDDDEEEQESGEKNEETETNNQALALADSVVDEAEDVTTNDNDKSDAESQLVAYQESPTKETSGRVRLEGSHPYAAPRPKDYATEDEKNELGFHISHEPRFASVQTEYGGYQGHVEYGSKVEYGGKPTSSGSKDISATNVTTSKPDTTPVDVQIRIVGYSLDELPEGSTSRRMFITACVHDVERALNLDPTNHQVSVLSLRSGSVIPTIHIQSAAVSTVSSTSSTTRSPTKLAQQLQKQIKDPNSILRSGIIGKNVDPEFFMVTNATKPTTGQPSTNTTSLTNTTHTGTSVPSVSHTHHHIVHNMNGTLSNCTTVTTLTVTSHIPVNKTSCVLIQPTTTDIHNVPDVKYESCKCPTPAPTSPPCNCPPVAPKPCNCVTPVQQTCKCVPKATTPPKPLPGQGPTGDKGPAGPVGPKGPKGDKGEPGNNATFPVQQQDINNAKNVLNNAPNSTITATRISILQKVLQPKWASQASSCPDHWTRTRYDAKEKRVYCDPPKSRSLHGPFNSACAFTAKFPRHYDRCGWSIQCKAPWKAYMCYVKGNKPWTEASILPPSIAASKQSNGMASILYGAPNSAIEHMANNAVEETKKVPKKDSLGGTGIIVTSDTMKQAKALRDSIIEDNTY